MSKRAPVTTTLDHDAYLGRFRRMLVKKPVFGKDLRTERAFDSEGNLVNRTGKSIDVIRSPVIDIHPDDTLAEMDDNARMIRSRVVMLIEKMMQQEGVSDVQWKELMGLFDLWKHVNVSSDALRKHTIESRENVAEKLHDVDEEIERHRAILRSYSSSSEKDGTKENAERPSEDKNPDSAAGTAKKIDREYVRANKLLLEATEKKAIILDDISMQQDFYVKRPATLETNATVTVARIIKD